MKIAICLYPIMDLGGIVNHTEQLIGGFKDLGHSVDLLELSWKNKHPRANNKAVDTTWEWGPSGIQHHQGKGWNFPARNRFGYKGTWRLNETKQKLEGYDLIIWSVPVPTKLAEHHGNSDWPKLYDLKHPKQIAVIHDGNCASACPHILHIAGYLTGLACVHPCAYNGADIFPIKRQMILNPQDLSDVEHTLWDDKAVGFISLQTFKAWKHVHELIRAIAYMPERKDQEFRWVVGEGIEYRYMVSEEKCKPQYYHSFTMDDDDNPSDSKWYAGMKIWDAAIEQGMQRPDKGWWSATVTTAMLKHTRILVDPSWSSKYSMVGGHPNRVVVDAIRCGAIPVARPLGMGAEIFQAGIHYVPIPHGVGPQEYADIVLDVGNMSKTKVTNYQEAGRDKLQLFERGKIASMYLSLAEGDHTATGVVSASLIIKCNEVLENFFEV